MSRTVSDAVAEARILLNDEDTPYRYSDEDLIRYLNNSLAEIYRLRPDIYMGQYSTGPTVFDTSLSTSGGLSYPLSDLWFPASVDYMVSMSEARNDQATANGRAQYFMQLFTGILRGG